MNYALLALVALVLLAGLVGFGVGHRRWSWGTLVAAVLVLLTAAGYLYLVSRFTAYEWSWAEFVRSKKVQLAKVRDAQAPDAAAGGRLKPVGGEQGDPATKPIARLEEERERWRRALDRANTWRGRFWRNAAFEPPKADGGPGTVEIPFAAAAPPAADAADAADPATAKPAVPDSPPIDPGATIYLFDDAAAQDGGRYLGAFLVEDAKTDAATGRSTLTVRQTAARDPYDAATWAGAHDAVTVYESLPSDRWVAFSATGREPGGDGVVPQPKRLSIEQVEELLDERDRQRAFLDDVDRHESVVTDEKEWDSILERLEAGAELPGSYWAEVTFKEPATVTEPRADEEATRTFETGARAEFDLQTAFALARKGTVTIEKVRYRRRLRDAGTLLHGTTIFPSAEAAAGGTSGITADGVAALLASLRAEIATLEASLGRLTASRKAVEAEIQDVRERERRLTEDTKSWARDVDAAERTAAAFEAELEQARGRLQLTERAIVDLGTNLRTAIGRLVERIDAAAPAPGSPAASP